jgi:hypothetical protein
MLSEDIATLRQMRALGTDWAEARINGYKDPEIFQTKWYGANPLGPIVNGVKAEIGPLKGMPGNGAAAPAAGSSSAPSGPPARVPGLPQVLTPDEARKLPPGTRFQMPDGRLGTVPGAQ